MSLTDLLPKILLALATTVFSDIYKRICRWLTDQGNQSIDYLFLFQVFLFVENYREQRVHDDQMIAKLFAVKFIFFLNIFDSIIIFILVFLC